MCRRSSPPEAWTPTPKKIKPGEVGASRTYNTNLRRVGFAYMELQTRSQAMFNHFFLLRDQGGINYRINKNFIAFVGFAQLRYLQLEKPAQRQNHRRAAPLGTIGHQRPLSRLKFEHGSALSRRPSTVNSATRFGIGSTSSYRSTKRRWKTTRCLFPLSTKSSSPIPHPISCGTACIWVWATRPPNFSPYRPARVNQFNYTLSNKGGKNNLSVSLNFRFTHKDNKYERMPTLPD